MIKWKSSSPSSWAKAAQLVRHPLILAFYLPALFVSFSEGILIPVMPVFAKGLDVSYGLVGLVLAGEGLGMLLGDVPAGMLLRRLGRKGAMLLGLGCLAVSSVVLFGSTWLVPVFLSRLFGGFGHALWGVSRHAYITDSVPAGERGRAIALLGGVFRVGHFLGPMAGGVLAAHYGLRASFLLFGGAILVAMILVGAYLRSVPGEAHARARLPRRHGSVLWSMFRSQWRNLASAGLGQLFAQTIRGGTGVIIPLYAADVLGLDVQAIGFVVSISTAVDMSLFYPAGWIMDHWGRKSAIVPSFALQALGMALVPLTGSAAALTCVAALVCLGNGLGSGCMMTLGADLAPREARGEFLGVWRLIGDAGNSGGPLAVGNVAGWVTLPTAAWVLSGIGFIAAAIFGFLVPETLARCQRVPGQRQTASE